MNNTLVEMKNISSTINNKVILNDINITLKKNEIHAVIGENGSGKSFLMKVLAGNVKNYTGKIYLDGKRVRFKNVHDAHKAGIHMIYHTIT